MNERKFVFFVNNSCLRGNYSNIKSFLNESFSDSFVIRSKSIDDTYKLSKQLGNSVDGFIAVGGDGTANTVLNSMILSGHHNKLFGILPFGSGNDFANAGLGISNFEGYMKNHNKQDKKNTLGLKSFVKTIYGDDFLKEIDIGYFKPESEEKRYFLNILGQGFDAKVVLESDKWKNVWKDKRYELATLVNMLSYRKNFASKIEELYINDKQVKIENETLMLALMNSREAGNGLPLNPYGNVSDSSLEFLLLEKIDRLDFLKLFLGLSAKKTDHIHNRNVLYLYNRISKCDLEVNLNIFDRSQKSPLLNDIKKVEKINVKTALSLPVEIDGEFAGYHDRFEAGLVKDFKIKAIYQP